MRVLAAALAVLCLGAVTIAGCGGKAKELSKQDARELSNSRSDLDDALDAAETLRTSKAEARRLRSRVRKVISEGSLEGGGEPDEFGLAALGRLRDLVPSLVVEEGESVRSLDERETRAFLRYAVENPARALYPAAEREVANIERVTGAEDVGPKTKIPTLHDQTVDSYLREATRDTRSLWPRLAQRLDKARASL